MDTTFQHPAPMERQRALGFAKRAHFDKEPVMHINFVSRVDGPQRLICEAELIFDADGPLAGLRLVGFCLWRGTDGATYVTFPSRAFGAGDERRLWRGPRYGEVSLGRPSSCGLSARLALHNALH